MVTFLDSLEIKGRGNSTFIFPKKPFRLKLKNSSGLLGMPKSKHWALLANFEDRSLTRTRTAMGISKIFEMPYTPRMRTVEVMIGEFHWGTYELIEVPKIALDRVNIDVVKTINGKTTGGVIFEFDHYLEEDYFFFTEKYQLPFVIKDPDDLNTTVSSIAKQNFEYLKNVLQAAENSVYDNFINQSLKNYHDYFNLSSLVKWYLVQEVTKNIDLDKSSVYMYIDTKNENKITFSPVWDFDFSMGNLEDPFGVRPTNFPWISDLVKDSTFYNEIIKEYKGKRIGLLNQIIALINRTSREKYLSQKINFSIWTDPHYDGFFKESYPDFSLRKSYAEEILHLKKWLLDRINWMDGYYLKEVYPDIAVVSCDLYLEMDEDEIIDTTLKGLSKNDLSKSLLLVQFPRHGKVIFSDSDSDGKFKYVPHSNFNGIDSFYMSYQSNGIIIDTSLVEVRVKSKNDKPHMDALFLELLEDGQLKSDVDHGFKNYVLDPDDSVFQFEKLIEPKNGAFVLNLNGAYEYTPKLNLFGTDSVCISVSDLYSASDTCWIYFEVKSLNDRPFFNRDTLYFQINADSLFNLNLIITEGFVNDIDNRSNELKVKVKANPKNGK
ncbi:MAG: CotH kinase family protein, partial [Bacteroidota bacterium]